MAEPKEPVTEHPRGRQKAAWLWQVRCGMSKSPFVILLVEDDPNEAELFTALCTQDSPDIEVRHASNGQEALHYLERGHARDPAAPRPDLIMLDLQMPIMDGHMFLEEAKHRDHFQHIPTLVLSVSKKEDDIRRSYQNFASGYLVKPDSLEELKELIQMVLSYWRGTARLPTLGDLT